MPKPLQAKLLRALEAGEVRRIGENETRRVDVRFVAATNLDIQAAVDSGEFRSDLFYRLNVHRIHLPPLRERGEDLATLIDHFLQRFGGGTVTGCTPAATRGACSRTAIPATSASWSTSSSARSPWPAATADRRRRSAGGGPRAAAAAPAAEGTVAAARERAEREMIVATLAKNNGEVSAAARELQVSRTTMWRLMKKHGIST